MKVYRYEKKQLLSITLEEAWSFISNPNNLKLITPPDMNFSIRGPEMGLEIYEGMIISYRVSPFALFRISWVSEITHISAPYYFVDEQRSGPYSFWHHQHWLEQQSAGILMTDVVHYALPFGWLGRIINPLVHNRIETIFEYRQYRLNEWFT